MARLAIPENVARTSPAENRTLSPVQVALSAIET